MPGVREGLACDYCRFQRHPGGADGASGAYFGNLILRQGHARLTAYAAVHSGDATLAARAWRDFYTGDG